MLKLMLAIFIFFQIINAQAIPSGQKDRGFNPYTQGPKEKRERIIVDSLKIFDKEAIPLTKAQEDSISNQELKIADPNTIYLNLDSTLSPDQKKLALNKAQKEANHLSIGQGSLIVLGAFLGTGFGLGITTIHSLSCAPAAGISKVLNAEEPECVDNLKTVATLSIFTGTSLGILLAGYKGLSFKTITATLGATLVGTLIAVQDLDHGTTIFLLPPLSGVLGYFLSYDPGIKVLEAQAKLIDNEVKLNYELIGYSFNF